MPAIKKSWEGKYKSHPDRWDDRDLKRLDRMIAMAWRDDPLSRSVMPLEFQDDLRKASLATYYALVALKKHIIEYKRRNPNA